MYDNRNKSAEVGTRNQIVKKFLNYSGSNKSTILE